MSYPVIIRYTANNLAFFAGFITEAAVKRARTPTAAVPPQQELHWLP